MMWRGMLCSDVVINVLMQILAYSLNNQSDVYYTAKQALPEGNNGIDNMSISLTGTHYGVSVFALEDGLPFPRVVTLLKNVTVANGFVDVVLNLCHH